MANILFDDTQLSATYGPTNWNSIGLYRFVGGTATWPGFADGTSGANAAYGWISFSFQGTGVAVTGNTPKTGSDDNFAVSIDGGSLNTQSYGDNNIPTSMQWYQSGKLSDSTHSINITHLAGTSVDFVVVQAGNNTPLSGKTLIVDDNDDSIGYSGSWNEVVKQYSSRENPHQGWPYGKGTHRATSAGPSATFRFTGTSVNVYGLFNYQELGTLNVQYTIDGVATTLDYSIDSSNDLYKAGYLERENTSMFSKDGLSAGDHTLLIEVTACSGKTFALDYITYKPSFSTLANKPSLSNSPASNSGSGSSSLPSAASIPSASTISAGSASITSPGSPTSVSSSQPSGTDTAVSALGPVGSTIAVATSTSTPSNGSGSSTGSDHNTSATGSTTKNTGAIAGGVVGGVVVLLLVGLAFIFWKRRKQRAEVAALDKEAPSGVQPFTTPASRFVTTNNSSATGFASEPHSKPTLAGRYAHPDTPPSDRSASPLLVPNRLGVSSEKASLAAAAAAASAASETSSTSGGQADPQLISRMQRLQELVTELNDELLRGGDNNPRVPELRGRIAELTRQDSESAAYVARHLRQSAVPPPYETSRF